jgi:hypothetical protein
MAADSDPPVDPLESALDDDVAVLSQANVD